MPALTLKASNYRTTIQTRLVYVIYYLLYLLAQKMTAIWGVRSSDNIFLESKTCMITLNVIPLRDPPYVTRPHHLYIRPLFPSRTLHNG
jgi:hypothetical protein